MARKSTRVKANGVRAAKSESRKPGSVDKEPESETPINPSESEAALALEDAELVEMLEQLSETINTAQTVLNEQHRIAMESGQPKLAPPPDLPQIEPPPFEVDAPASKSVPVISVISAIVSVVLAIGALGAWWLFLNQPDSSFRSKTAKDESRIGEPVGTANPRAELPTRQAPPLPKRKPTALAAVDAFPTTAAVQREPVPSPAIKRETVARLPVQDPVPPQTSVERTAALPQTTVNQTPQVTARVSPPEPKKPAPLKERPAQIEQAEPPKQVPARNQRIQLTPAEQHEIIRARKELTRILPEVAKKPDIAVKKPIQIARTAPEKPAKVTEPATRPTPLAPLTEAQLRNILRRGADLSMAGDIAGARLVLEYAALRGSAEAMFALGQTFDPDFLDSRGVIGMAPDVATALKWYSRSADLGFDPADARANELEKKVGQGR